MKPRIDPGQSLGPQETFDHADPQAAARRAQEKQRAQAERDDKSAMARARILEEATQRNTIQCGCGTWAIWTVTAKGKKMLVDAAEVTDQTPRFTLEPLGRGQLRAVYIDKAGQLDHKPGHVSHFATCPNASNHRRNA